MIVGISGKALLVFLLSSRSYLNKIISWLYCISLMLTMQSKWLGSREQGIEDNKTESSIRLMHITGDSLHDHPLREGHQQFPQRDRTSDEDAQSSYSPLSIVSAPGLVSTGFYLGPSSEGRVAGNQNNGKAQRKRPQSWKRNLTGRSTVSPNHHESCGSGRSHKSCWGADCDVQSSTVDRINRCRRGILRWKKCSDINSRNRITRLKSSLEREVSKINVGASWDGDTIISGASWINRNSRSYSGVKFFLEAEFLATFWAIEAVKNLRLNSVILEVSSKEVYELITNSLRGPQNCLVLNNLCSLLHTAGNYHITVASEVVASVTRDLRLHSYVASGGLRWLTPLINLEAAANGHALR
ncbi:LOW QUALITY PROTEIN: hypothetical protein HID58_087218, partial [Brassica napus]